MTLEHCGCHRNIAMLTAQAGDDKVFEAHLQTDIKAAGDF